jgi:hypothetical protein
LLRRKRFPPNHKWPQATLSVAWGLFVASIREGWGDPPPSVALRLASSVLSRLLMCLSARAGVGVSRRWGSGGRNSRDESSASDAACGQRWKKAPISPTGASEESRSAMPQTQDISQKRNQPIQCAASVRIRTMSVWGRTLDSVCSPSEGAQAGKTSMVCILRKIWDKEPLSHIGIPLRTG